MRFTKGMDVMTAWGEKMGSLSRVVIDAKTREVTDIVVEQGLLAGGEKVIPVGLLDAEQEDRIQLQETNQGVDDFLDYETTHYVPVDPGEVPYEGVQASYWYPPVNPQHTPASGMLPDVPPERVPRTETSIPEGRVAISQGAEVFSSDEQHLGNVEEVIVDASSQLSHFVIGKGFLMHEHKLVPAAWAERVTEDRVYLSVRAELFERLPDYNRD